MLVTPLCTHCWYLHWGSWVGDSAFSGSNGVCSCGCRAQGRNLHLERLSLVPRARGSGGRAKLLHLHLGAPFFRCRGRLIGAGYLKGGGGAFCMFRGRLPGCCCRPRGRHLHIGAPFSGSESAWLWQQGPNSQHSYLAVQFYKCREFIMAQRASFFLVAAAQGGEILVGVAGLRGGIFFYVQSLRERLSGCDCTISRGHLHQNIDPFSCSKGACLWRHVGRGVIC